MVFILKGKVYSLGRKEYGRLGMGADAVDLAVPTPIPALGSLKCVEVAAGESVSLAVTESGPISKPYLMNKVKLLSKFTIIKIKFEEN